MNDLINLGNTRPLEDADLWDLSENDKCVNASSQYQYYKQLYPKSWVITNLFRVIRPKFIIQLTCAVFASLLSFAGPFFLYRIVNYIQNPESGSLYYGLALLLGMLGCSLVKAVIDGQMYFLGRRSGIRLRSILIGEIYSKSLKRVSSASSNNSNSTDGSPDQQASLGKIVTLMSVDAERVLMFICYAHQLMIETPMSTFIAIASLFSVLGWSAVSGILVILITSPLGGHIGKTISRIQEEAMANTDKRVSIMNEILQGIRIIKYFAWEKRFAEKVNEAREQELKSIVKLWGAYIAFGTIGYGGGLVVAFVTFATYTLIAGKTLDAATAFTAMNLLHVVSGLLAFLPHHIMTVYKAKVAMDRIIVFLSEDELEKYALDCDKSLKDKTSYSSLDTLVENVSNGEAYDYNGESIGFKNARYSYYGTTNEKSLLESNKETDPLLIHTLQSNGNQGFHLENLDIDFPLGGLSLVCGSTGAGKSSLVLALLGELKRLQGQQYLPDPRNAAYDHKTGLLNAVAYAAQSAWLLNATIRDNILFGEPFDADRYQKVIKACALARDLETLEGGDLTEIGEKGVNVSGGQKQRISLARACYSKAKFVLLDDPLSAVDAPTAKFLVDNAIRGLLKDRTCILVSHAVHLVLPHADYAAVIKNGVIVAQGTSQDLVKDPLAEGIYGIDLTLNSQEDEDLKAMYNSQPYVLPDKAGTTLIDDEERAVGSVRFEVYQSYLIAAGGILFISLFFFSLIVCSTVQFGNDWWLKTWTDSTAVIPQVYNITVPNKIQSSYVSGDVLKEITMTPQSLSFFQVPDPQFVPLMSNLSVPAFAQETSHQPGTMFYISVYGLFGISLITVLNLQTLVQLYGSLVASRSLHNNLLVNILGAPLRFFEVTPIGRILNRFSKDVENVDNYVMEYFIVFIQKVIQVLTILIVISSVIPPFLFVVFPVFFIYMWVARLYLKTSRELKRLDAVSRSPIYAQFSETLAGATTIRAYGAESRFLQMNEEKVDANHRAFFYLWTANRWLCLRTDMISAFVVFFAGIGVISGQLGPGWAGLLMTYALDFTQALLWTVRLHAEMEMSLNSVERVNEYTTIEQEPPAHIQETAPIGKWPSEGRITVSNLRIRYAMDQPDVLMGISFEAKACEKIAVVGRTGAGKSTLSLAFFRIIPLSGGSITIDGIDISTLGLSDLRSRLTIIPQDPVLFSGTLRSNLDPLEEHDDATLWEALKKVRILDLMQQNEDGSCSLNLDSQICENGSNFSQGQRQLLCLARALLRQSRVIFLDEATASVDNETDARIQETIREQFVNGTVLCIAHRLRTVIDYDKVLVLDKGNVVEFGRPIDLIESSSVGTFRKMVEETGEFDELVDLARNSAKFLP